MDSENRPQTDSLAESVLARLRARPFGFDFFAALRAVESRFRHHPRIGATLSVVQDPIRFGQKPDLAFPTSTLEGLEDRPPGHRPRLNVRFFGLLGPNGPLPLHFTEYARDRMRNIRDSTLSAFFDIFHHRMISFFYRAWAVNQKAVDYDRPGQSRFALYVGSLLGVGEPSLRGRDSLPDNAKLYYSGLLSSHTKNVVGLESLIADFFQVKVAIESLVGHWLPVPRRHLCALGISAESASLGVNSVLGSRIWDVQNRFRIRIGPVAFERFQHFLPSESSFRRLSDWVAFYTGHQFHWDLQLVLLADQIPATQLGGNSRLGWTCWLKSTDCHEDSSDLVIDRSETRSEKQNHTL